MNEQKDTVVSCILSTYALRVADMGDKEVLADWVGDFLVYRRNSGIDEQDAANTIMRVLSRYAALFAKSVARPCSDPIALYETLANPNRRGRLCGCCDVLSELHQSSKK